MWVDRDRAMFPAGLGLTERSLRVYTTIEQGLKQFSRSCFPPREKGRGGGDPLYTLKFLLGICYPGLSFPEDQTSPHYPAPN
jgi:hypothetical protein